MTDWKALALAGEMNIPDEDIAKIAPVLDEVEQAFRPLLKELPRAYAEWE